jgi:hypothetical protein
LGRRRFSFSGVFLRSFYCFLFWHNKRVSPHFAQPAVRNFGQGCLCDVVTTVDVFGLVR